MASKQNQKKKVKIIVDANALFVPLKFKIDIFTEIEQILKTKFELVILSQVKRELEKLAEKRATKIRKNASFALTLAERCSYIKVSEKAKEPTDDAIVRIAKEWEAAVFTNDKLLRKRLRDINVPVIYLREKSRLEIDGLIS